AIFVTHYTLIPSNPEEPFSDTLLWTNGIDPDEGLEDDQLLEMLINDLVQSQQGQMMEPFTPVVINILRSWLSQTKKI
ncbi:MAG: hypothetical protein WCP16_23705, partial [Pseudanabaena sp. ELA645]